MNKKLDLTIVDAIRMIIDNADCDVTYNIHKGTDDILFKKQKKEVIKVDITLIKNL
jgi:hypothetical protein